MDHVGDGGAVADVRDEAEFLAFVVHESLHDAESASRAGRFTKDDAGEQYICCDVWMCFVELEDTAYMVSMRVVEVA